MHDIVCMMHDSVIAHGWLVKPEPYTAVLVPRNYHTLCSCTCRFTPFIDHILHGQHLQCILSRCISASLCSYGPCSMVYFPTYSLQLSIHQDSDSVFDSRTGKWLLSISHDQWMREHMHACMYCNHTRMCIVMIV